MIVSTHAINRYIQRIDRSSVDPRKDILENVKLARPATEEESHFIQYSRARLAKSVKGNKKFTGDKDKYLIHNEIAYCVVNDVVVVTLFEVGYLRNINTTKPQTEKFEIYVEDPTDADIADLLRYYKDGWKVFINGSKEPRAIECLNDAVYIKTKKGLKRIKELHPFRFNLEK